MASKKAVAYRCPKCIAEGSYTGRLVFGDDEPGNCPYHKTTPLVAAPQKEGNK